MTVAGACVSLSTSSKHYLAVSPVDGSLYVSDAQQRRVMRLTTDDKVADGGNVEVVAGNGQTCVGDVDHHRCGDGQLAVHAALSYPKGLSSQLDTSSSRVSRYRSLLTSLSRH